MASGSGGIQLTRGAVSRRDYWHRRDGDWPWLTASSGMWLTAGALLTAICCVGVFGTFGVFGGGVDGGL